jgi:hypothetical protein
MSFKSTSVVAALVLSFAAVIFVQIEWGIAGSYPGDEFFELAAQTIPVLLVALAVEAQARRFDYSEAGKSLRIAAIIVLGAGETTAVLISAGLLHPELGSTMSKVFVVVTAAGLLGGFIGVLWVALVPRLGNQKKGEISRLPLRRRSRRSPSPLADGFGVLLPPLCSRSSRLHCYSVGADAVSPQQGS